MLQSKQQEANTGGKAKMPDNCRCTITCAFCGRLKHYRNECYCKQRLSTKVQSDNSQNWGQNGKGNSDKGKGKSHGRFKGEEQGKGGPGGPHKKNDKNRINSGETLPLNQGEKP